MNRNLLLVALMVLAAIPAANAHTPPAPILTCQNIALGDGITHEYLPPNTGNLVLGGDGNLANCAKPNPIEVGLGLCLDPETTGVPVVCDPYNTGVEQPILDYDGELDYGHGGAFLFVRTGDGVSDGVTACFGWPSVGHHSTTIYATDILGFGPQFTVTSDFSRAGLEESPDCGDSYVEPCDPNPPVPSTQPFPVNVVIDTVNGVLYTIFGPSGAGCNNLDNAQRFASTAGPDSGGAVTFGAGADGALVVFIEPDTNNLRIPTFGHISTM